MTPYFKNRLSPALRAAKATQNRFSKLLVLLVPAALTMTSLALPTDSEQPLSLSSDQLLGSLGDEKSKTQTYSGNVEIQQGSLKIHADKVVIYSQEDQVSLIIATGQPALYSQIAREGEEPVVAKARRMEYDIKGKTLQLIDGASIVLQKGETLSGNRISYDVKKAQVKAEGKTEGGEDGRVRMVIPPEAKSETE